MRAIFFKGQLDSDDKVVTISGEEAHHLIKVVRIRIHDEILLLNGDGLWVNALVKVVTRKEVDLKVISYENYKRKETFDVAVGITKRDAVSDWLKIATELGVNRIIPFQTEYSQRDFIKRERVPKLLESACIQANSAFAPEVLKPHGFSEICFDKYDKVILFCEQQLDQQCESLKASDRTLLIFGPEGGFSEREIRQFRELKNADFVHLQTNILRTPTALAAGAGWYLGKIYK